MNNNQTAQSSIQNNKNNYHATGCLKREGISMNRVFNGLEFVPFLLNILYGSEAAVSFNG